MSRIRFSRRDREIGIIVPEKVTPDVAELTGIITARDSIVRGTLGI